MAQGGEGSRDMAAAALASLHIGIEPAILPLLLATGAVPGWGCGCVVGAGQLGMSIGAALCWHWAAAGRRVAAFAGVAGSFASLGLARADGLAEVLLLRFGLGLALGLCFARASADATHHRPHRMIGGITLAQQLVATSTMGILPALAARAGAPAALAALGLIPLLVSALSWPPGSSVPYRLSPEESTETTEGAARLFLTLAPMALLLAVTAMVWSYIGAVGNALGLASPAIATAVACASLAGAPAALAASLLPPRMERCVTVLLGGAATIAPLMLPRTTGLGGYWAAMILFNAGSAIMGVRICGWATERTGARGRRLVATTQCAAMGLGAPLGALAVARGGLHALGALAIMCTVAALCATVAQTRAGPTPTGARWLPA